MRYTDSEFAAFCDGVKQTITVLDQMAEALDAEINVLAENCTTIGRGGSGYAVAKTKMRCAEHHYATLRKTAATLREKCGHQHEVVQLVDAIVEQAVADAFNQSVAEGAARLPVTGIRLKSSNPLGLRPAVVVNLLDVSARREHKTSMPILTTESGTPQPKRPGLKLRPPAR